MTPLNQPDVPGCGGSFKRKDREYEWGWADRDRMGKDGNYEWGAFDCDFKSSAYLLRWGDPSGVGDILQFTS